MKQSLFFLLSLLLPLALAAQEREPGDNQAAADRLADILQATSTLQADVSQLTLDQDGREIQEFQARLVMQKPDHFSWEILSPYAELTLTDGQRIWRLEPDLEQVTVDNFSAEVNRTPVLLLNGDAEDIAGNYTVSAADMDFGSRQRFILTPRAPDSLFERLSLTFNETTLEEMQFEDSLGQKTSLIFSNLETNAAIDPAVFVFHMPEGMEIIDNTQ